MEDIEIQQTEGYIKKALQQYTMNDSMIAEFKEKFMVLKVEGVDDKKGYDLVHAARMDVKKARITIEKTRKILKEESLIFGRAMDGEAKRLTALLEPIETYLLSHENAVDDKKKAIKEAAAKKEQEMIDNRTEAIFGMGMTFDGSAYVYQGLSDEKVSISQDHIKMMNDQEFQEVTEKVAELQKKADDIRAKEKADKEAEEQKQLDIAKENERVRLEQEKIASDLVAQQEKINADKKAMEEAKRKESEEKERKVREAKEAEEAEAKRIQDEKDAKAKAEKEAKEETERIAKAKAEAEEQERIRKELEEKLKPDNEKLIALASSIAELPMPSLTEKQSHEVLDKAKGFLDRAVQTLKQGS